MAGLLADVFSFGDTLKRKARGLLDDPMGTISQFVNNENDRARAFNQLTSQSTDEMISGQTMGPASQKLAGLLADAYNPAGMVVWHGSPHKFTKFDASKIGTGEGAQAYGHGLYVAESPKVAQQYADTLTDKAPKYLDGVSSDKLSTAQKSALGMLAESGGNVNAALLAAKTDMARSGGAGAEFHVERYNTLRDIAKGKVSAQVGEPSLYKIDLPDEHIAKMLDWDKPLSQQAPEVRNALEMIVPNLPKGKQDELLRSIRGQLADYERDWAPVTGANLYRQLGQMNGAGVKTTVAGVQDASPVAADVFRNAGIPGIRYLDGGSRGTGQGTSNFVVFPGNEHLLNILERNGQPIGLLGQ